MIKLLRFLAKRSVKMKKGVVRWCEGVMYLTSPGCPTDIGLQLGKACYLVAGMGRWGMF